MAELYRYFNEDLGTWLSFRLLDLERDLERFNRWQNSDRVAAFWNERGSLEHHRGYLSRLFQSGHALPVIGSFDDDPFLYLEVYWAKQDRLAAYYAAEDHDRGIHMLVGEERHRGPHKVRAWLGGLCRFLFQSSEQTTRVVSEPRFDNRKMIGYMQEHGFEKICEFDFPHKRAALMILSRDTFFGGRSS